MLDHRHVQPQRQQCPRRLKPQQPPADDRRVTNVTRISLYRQRVIQRAQGKDALLVSTLERGHKGATARGKQQAVIFHVRAIGQGQAMGSRVERCGANPQVQANTALGVPLRRSKVERLLPGLTGDKLPQAGAAVIGIRLCAKDVHLGGRIGPCDALRRRYTRDAVAYDNVSSHWLPPVIRLQNRSAISVASLTAR